MRLEEITAGQLSDSGFMRDFINKQTKHISDTVGSGLAINALSGGVDSSAVTMLGYITLGGRLLTYFVDNGLMREGEPQYIASIFEGLGIPVRIANAQEEFFKALRGITDPEEKREAITQTFYRNVFRRLVRESGAKYLIQGTNLTDVEETQSGIKRQHNVFEQIGINPQEAFGYKIIEPLIHLRKDGVRKVAEALGLPKIIYNRPPFPGPALATRVIGEVTPERINIVRKATAIVEEEIEKEIVLNYITPFQYMAILHKDKVTGMRNGKRDFGMQIEVRCWDSVDARTATPTNLSFKALRRIGNRVTKEVPGVVSVTYNIAEKPPSTIEVI